MSKDKEISARLNNIPVNLEIEGRDERKWFSFIKHSAQRIDYGEIELKITIKAGNVVNIKNIREIENFNIHS
jgi:hypothetical protein